MKGKVRRNVYMPQELVDLMLKEKKKRIINASLNDLIVEACAEKYGLMERKAS